MTITTEQKLEAATLIIEAFSENIKTEGHFTAALLSLSTAAKEIEKLTGVVEALQFCAGLEELRNTVSALQISEALARFKELTND